MLEGIVSGVRGNMCGGDLPQAWRDEPMRKKSVVRTLNARFFPLASDAIISQGQPDSQQE